MKPIATQRIKKIAIKVSLLTIISFLFSANNANAQCISGSTVTSWCLVGNTGTTAGTNYVGTFDFEPLVFKTFNTERIRILTSGNVGIGLFAPASLLHSAGQISTGIPLGGLGGAVETNGSLLFYNSTNTNTVNVQSGATSVSYSLTLPATQGAASTVLTNNGAGILNWTSPTNGTVTLVTGIAPIISSGGTAPDISITQAGISANGFLSSTDWNTFNNKLAGSGTFNYVPKWTPNGATLGNSSIFDNGNVGIGTTNPLANLEVKNGNVLFDGTTGSAPISGPGTRMMWVSAKAAFRAGAVNNTQWDNANIGLYSAALGYSTTAESYACFVVGRFNRPSASYSKTTWVPTDPVFVVGIGQDSQKSGNALTVLKNGKVGIGTQTPSEKLDVIGLLKLPKANATQNDSPGLIFASDDDFLFTGRRFNHYGVGAYATNVGLKLYLSGRYGLNFFTGGINRMTIDLKGNVGIGTDLASNTDNYQLAVNGKIRAKKVVVETLWSDFVFEKNYKLASLEEVEKYIKQNGHLPQIPSAKEVETNGADLGTLVKLQMQKIEELTLYIIEQNKRIEKLEIKSK